MKLIVAIINNDDCNSVLNGLSRKGLSATKLSTSGGFLRAGNATLLIGTEEEKVDEVIEIIGEYSRKRSQMVSPSPLLCRKASFQARLKLPSAAQPFLFLTLTNL